MRVFELGKTGLMVSGVGFGGIPIQRLSDDQAVGVVRSCLELGVNFLDTAHGYGTSEERIGKAITGQREGLILASKSPGRDAKTFCEQMELSFQRLGVEYIDLYQFHNISKQEDYERLVFKGGALEAAREAKAAGRIGHIGVTSHKLNTATELVKSELFETLMFPFNYITSEPAEELIPLCQKHNVGFIAMKPMGGGLLENANLCFKYLRQFSGVVPVVGIQSREEIKEIVSIVESGDNLNETEKSDIARMCRELGNRFCRACDYCQPCPQEIPISMIMRLKSAVKRFPDERFYGEWGQKMVEKAETCTDCGECESRCPYELPIRDMMKENVAWYHEQMALYQAR